MTILKFWQLSIKAFFRAPQWEVAIIAKIFLGLFAAYMFASILVIGVGIYYILGRTFPEHSTIDIINQGVFFMFLIEFIGRFFFQQPPTTHVQSWMLLPIKKNKILNDMLFRSLLNPFNYTTWLLYFPIAVVRVIEGTSWTTSLIWFFHLLCITLILNYLIFLINKSNRFFISTLVLVILGISLEFYTDFSSYKIFATGLNWLEQNPISLLITAGLLVLIYRITYQFLKSRFYLDMGLAKKSEKVLRLGFAFLGGYGRIGAFLKNDLRLLLRNARPKQVLLIAFMFLFYGLLFFSMEMYRNNSIILVFAAIFITGGFSFTYGQQVPSWDSEYYPLLMTQNLTYREYLDSKWWLMFGSVVISLILSTFYLIFGWKTYLYVFTGAIYNLGIGSLITLYSGAFFNVPVKLNVKAKAFTNTKAFSLTQLLFTFPKLGLPILFFFIPDFFVGGYAGWITLIVTGLLVVVLRKLVLNHIAKIYRNRKYKTIEAFSKN